MITTLVRSLRALVESPAKSRPIGFTADLAAKPE